jgi:hypothetical protein
VYPTSLYHLLSLNTQWLNRVPLGSIPSVTGRATHSMLAVHRTISTKQFASGSSRILARRCSSSMQPGLSAALPILRVLHSVSSKSNTTVTQPGCLVWCSVVEGEPSCELVVVATLYVGSSRGGIRSPRGALAKVLGRRALLTEVTEEEVVVRGEAEGVSPSMLRWDEVGAVGGGRRTLPSLAVSRLVFTVVGPTRWGVVEVYETASLAALDASRIPRTKGVLADTAGSSAGVVRSRAGELPPTSLDSFQRPTAPPTAGERSPPTSTTSSSTRTSSSSATRRCERGVELSRPTTEEEIPLGEERRTGVVKEEEGAPPLGILLGEAEELLVLWVGTGPRGMRTGVTVEGVGADGLAPNAETLRGLTLGFGLPLGDRRVAVCINGLLCNMQTRLKLIINYLSMFIEGWGGLVVVLLACQTY